MSTDGGEHMECTDTRRSVGRGLTGIHSPDPAHADGTVAVQYYDLENATTAEPDLTDQFLVTCGSNCTNPASWASGGETRLSTSGSFNILAAPNTTSGAGFVGDYDGLVPTTGSSFGSAFVMATADRDGRPDGPVLQQRTINQCGSGPPRRDWRDGPDLRLYGRCSPAWHERSRAAPGTPAEDEMK